MEQIFGPYLERRIYANGFSSGITFEVTEMNMPKYICVHFSRYRKLFPFDPTLIHVTENIFNLSNSLSFFTWPWF